MYVHIYTHTQALIHMQYESPDWQSERLNNWLWQEGLSGRAVGRVYRVVD